MNRNYAVKDSDGNLNLDWKDEFKVLYEFVAHHHKFVEILAKFKNMWEGHLGSIRVVQHRIELGEFKDRPIKSAR